MTETSLLYLTTVNMFSRSEVIKYLDREVTEAIMRSFTASFTA